MCVCDREEMRLHNRILEYSINDIDIHTHNRLPMQKLHSDLSRSHKCVSECTDNKEIEVILAYIHMLNGDLRRNSRGPKKKKKKKRWKKQQKIDLNAKSCVSHASRHINCIGCLE